MAQKRPPSVAGAASLLRAWRVALRKLKGNDTSCAKDEGEGEGVALNGDLATSRSAMGVGAVTLAASPRIAWKGLLSAYKIIKQGTLAAAALCDILSELLYHRKRGKTKRPQASPHSSRLDANMPAIAPLLIFYLLTRLSLYL